MDTQNIPRLVEQLARAVIKNNIKIATVESCTGGAIGKALTEQSGSSQWFAGGLITYTNESKIKLAGVDAQLIEKFGAVSLPVTEAMAQGALLYFDQCISVAVSGIAGPDGGTAEKPVGTVCIAVQYDQRQAGQIFHFEGDRQQVRQKTIAQGLQMMLSLLASDSTLKTDP